VATEDAVAALEFLLTHEDIRGAVNVVAPQPATNLEFTKALGRALHRPTLFPVPSFALRALFGRGIANEMLLVSQRAVPARLLAAGFRFRHATIEEALRASFAGHDPVMAAAR
jgi:NAD dependent epimerase/dehydratase family enzyme